MMLVENTTRFEYPIGSVESPDWMTYIFGDI